MNNRTTKQVLLSGLALIGGVVLVGVGGLIFDYPPAWALVLVIIATPAIVIVALRSVGKDTSQTPGDKSDQD